MGQKTNPIGYRLGYNYTWSSRWYAGKDYAKLLHQDVKIRRMVKSRLYHAGVSKVEIERSGDQTRVIIHTARPGIIIGRKGAEVDKLKTDLEKQYGGRSTSRSRRSRSLSLMHSWSVKMSRLSWRSGSPFGGP